MPVGRWTRLRSKKIAILGMFAAIAIVLSIVENTVMNMFNLAIPGAKPVCQYCGSAGALLSGAVRRRALWRQLNVRRCFSLQERRRRCCSSIGRHGACHGRHDWGKAVPYVSAAGVSALGAFFHQSGTACRPRSCSADRRAFSITFRCCRL